MTSFAPFTEIKEILGTFTCKDGKNTLQFIVTKSKKDEILLFYLNGNTDIVLSTELDDNYCLTLDTRPIQLKKMVTQITAHSYGVDPLFTLINLNQINKPTKINKNELERLFGCNIVDG